jgi:hypothetical protein
MAVSALVAAVSVYFEEWFVLVMPVLIVIGCVYDARQRWTLIVSPRGLTVKKHGIALTRTTTFDLDELEELFLETDKNVAAGPIRPTDPLQDVRPDAVSNMALVCRSDRATARVALHTTTEEAAYLYAYVFNRLVR